MVQQQTHAPSCARVQNFCKQKLTYYFIFLLVTIGFTTVSAQIPVKSGTFGQNAWYYNASESPYPTYLDTLLPSVAAAGVNYVRIGGISENFSPLYSWSGTTITSVTKLTHLIDQIRTNGMEPIIEVGYSPPSMGCTNSGISMNDQATIAGNLVNQINNVSYPTHHVQNWIIANEPDLGASCSGGFGYSGSTDAGQIASYIKAFSTQMKNADPNITVIGPELASFGNDKFYSVNIMVNDLISNPANSYSIMGTIPSGNGSGKYYIDVFSIHTYPTLTSRQAVIDHPMANPTGFYYKYIDDGNTTNQWRGLVEMINNNSTGRSISNLKLACTEFNIANCTTCTNEQTDPNGVLQGYDNRSFLGGQWLAEMLVTGMGINSGNESWMQFMNMWSIKEGDCNAGFGFLSGCSGTSHSRRPNYWHFKLVSDNFDGGTFYPTTGDGNADNHVKAYVCAVGSNVKVLVLNQEVNSTHSSSSNKTVTIAFNGSAATGSSNYKFHTNAAVTGSFPQQTVTVDNESSWVFEFNSSGQLVSHCYYTLYGTNALSYQCVQDLTCTPPTATASSNSPVCESQTIQLNANTVSGGTYSWTGPDGWTSTLQNPTRTGAADYMGGTYSLTITAGGCTSSVATTTVSVPQFSFITPSGSVSACNSQLLTGTSNPGGYVYQWKKDGSNITGATNQTYTATASGSYQLKITNGTCPDWSAPVSVTINAGPTASASSNSPVCQSATINLSTTTVTGASYSWQGPDGWTSTAQNPSRTGAAVTMAGTYTVTVTLNGCQAVSTTYVDVPDFASIGVSGSTTFCSGQGRSVTLYASTGTGYTWQWVKDGVNISGATANNYVASAAGNYQVRVTRPVGCNAWSAPTTVTTNTTLVAAVTPGGPTTVCAPATVVLYGNTCNGYTYQWQQKDANGVYQIIPGATNANYTVTTTGWYQVRTTLSGSNAWSSGVNVIINQCRQADPSAGASTTEVETAASPGIVVFPNPANGKFTIALTDMDATEKEVRVEVVNPLGQLVYSRTFESVKDPSMETVVDIEKEFTDGLYIVRVIVGDAVLYDKVMLSK